jgi:hypothetical protein
MIPPLRFAPNYDLSAAPEFADFVITYNGCMVIPCTLHAMLKNYHGNPQKYWLEG